MTVISRKLLMVLLVLLVILAGIYTYLFPVAILTPQPYPITRSPAELQVTYQDIVLRPADEDLELAAWWMPAAQPRANLVFVHGAGSNRHSEFFKSMAFYADLVARGISVLAFDLRNHGDSETATGRHTFGLAEKADAIAAVDWVRHNAPGLPLYAMGISMGGATLIHAAAAGADIDGLIFLDPLLHTPSAFTRGAWVGTGLPPVLFTPAAWAASRFHGLPGPGQLAGDVAAGLELPMLLMQDPDDPVTLAVHAQRLAQRNPAVDLWLAPAVGPTHSEIAGRGRWGTHVAAYALFPDQVLDRVMAFVEAPAMAPAGGE